MRRNYTYDAFGKLEGRAGYTENSYQFTGEQFDKNLGQYYLRQRYYNAEVGVFTQHDFLEGIPNIPLSQHGYLYVHANPVNASDPSGLLPAWLEGIFVHNAIGRDFLNSTQPILSQHDRLANRAISTILKQRPGSTLPSIEYFLDRPDLIDLTAQELYEIKKVTQKSQGAQDLIFYRDALNNHDPGWSIGTLYDPPATMAVPGVGRIIIEAPNITGSGYPGVVAYDKDNGSNSDWNDEINNAIIHTTEAIIATLIAYIALKGRSPLPN